MYVINRAANAVTGCQRNVKLTVNIRLLPAQDVHHVISVDARFIGERLWDAASKAPSTS